LLNLDFGDGKKSREFCFDNSWLKNPEFFGMIQDSWEQSVNSMDPIDVFNIKLKHVKKHLKGWEGNLFGNNRKRKLEVKYELLTLENLDKNMELSPDELSRRATIQAELFKMYEEEQYFGYQRAHSKWLLEGDQNTSYFHRIANGRKIKKTVHSLEKMGFWLKVLRICYNMLLTITRSFLVLLLEICFSYEIIFGPRMSC
jgi:hypothetical protein